MVVSGTTVTWWEGSQFFFLYRRQAVALRWWRMHRNCGGVDSIPWGFHFQASYYWLPHVNSVDFYHGWGMGIYRFTFYFGILSGMSEVVANNQWHDVRVDWCKWSTKGVYLQRLLMYKEWSRLKFFCFAFLGESQARSVETVSLYLPNLCLVTVDGVKNILDPSCEMDC